MPPILVKAHQALDRAVDAAYGRRTFASKAERVAFLFELYSEYVAGLPFAQTEAKGRKRKSA